MKKSRAVCWVILASILIVGCSRKNKDLEGLNREQARVIADLNQQVTGMQQELDQMKAGQGAGYKAPAAGVTQKANYIK